MKFWQIGVVLVANILMFFLVMVIFAICTISSILPARNSESQQIKEHLKALIVNLEVEANHE